MSGTDRQLAGQAEDIQKVTMRMADTTWDARGRQLLNQPRNELSKHRSGDEAMHSRSGQCASLAYDGLSNFGKGVQSSFCDSKWGRVRLSAYHIMKRSIDLTFGLTALLVLSPLLLIIAAIIKLSDGGPVLFGQERVGWMGKRFVCLKFRSMVLDAQSMLEQHLANNATAREEWKERQKLEKDPRITRLGGFLRRSSLDELPQLLNIILGDMSLVGPRPITTSELDRYGERVGYYLAVKPGLTGLWQISGRSNCTYAERVDLDVSYAVKHSLLLDFLIILKTVPAVIFRRGSI